MAKLELKYLGEFEVVRDGRPLALPPSKKTRALLAFLSLNPRRFRRDYLCELLWEVPDDPRGSLRWSLSKLRRLVDESGQQRLIADRTHVEIDTSTLKIDALELQALMRGGMADVPLQELEKAATRWRGNFLEGLDLPNFHDFHAWCIAEREQVARAQAALLQELVARLAEDAPRCLQYARALVGIAPYDEAFRAQLIRLLVRLGHAEEAEQQYQLGLRMLKEAGVAPSGTLHAARRTAPERASPPAPAAAGPAGDGRRFGTASGLIGRDEEAARLAHLLEEVREQKAARFALLRGEPGIGKTRLMDAVSALAKGAGATVLTASAYESESIRPFALWIDALHRHEASLAARIFGDREAGNRDRLFDRLSEFISTMAAEAPVVLVFDDIHWCDDSSAAALHYVARMNRERPVMGILAARDGDLRDNVAAQQAVGGMRHDGILTDIALGPLSEENLAQLIAARSPGAHAGELSRQCGGNPLLAIELARAEQEGDSSTSMTELVRERLARFGVEGTEVLQWAAVLSPRIDVEAIAELAGLEPGRVGEMLEAAERQGMLTATRGGLGFSHELLARAVYTTLSPLRRQVMHRRAADRLERCAAVDLGHAADLAHHAAQSGHPALAARAMVSAGRLCLRFYANDEALTLWRRGMQLVDQLSEAERVCLTIELHDIRLTAGPLEDWEASAREYTALAEAALDHGELSHARVAYHMAAYLRWEHGQWAHAREESLQSERVARSGREEDRIVGMAETARCLVMIERDLPRADAMLMEAAARAAKSGLSHHSIPTGLGLLRFHESKLDEAAELFKEALTLCKSAGARIDEFQVNEYLMMIEFQRQRYDEAARYCETLERIGEKLRVGSEGPFARALSVLCRYALYDDRKKLEPALQELRVVDAKHRLAYILIRAARLDLARGRLQDAARRASEALEYASLLQRATEMALAHNVLARICEDGNDFAGAAEHRAAMAELDTAGIAEWATAELRQQGGQREVAQT